MSKTAILVDGGFYRKRAKKLWGQRSPQETADGLITYARRHLKEHAYSHELYRIFYYDCPPVNKQMYHPLLNRTIILEATQDYTWLVSFLDCLN